MPGTRPGHRRRIPPFGHQGIVAAFSQDKIEADIAVQGIGLRVTRQGVVELTSNHRLDAFQGVHAGADCDLWSADAQVDGDSACIAV
ncbi:hypothetical protein D3C72_2410830 [compost metagenome]